MIKAKIIIAFIKLLKELYIKNKKSYLISSSLKVNINNIFSLDWHSKENIKILRVNINKVFSLDWHSRENDK